MKIITVLCAIAAAAAAQFPASAQTDTLIYSQFGALNQSAPGFSLYKVTAESDPGGGSTSLATNADVGLADLVSSGYSEVTANVQPRLVFVNAIANMQNEGTTPDGASIALKTYRYIYAVQLPRVPVATTVSNPYNAQAVHEMIQFWDGGGNVWPADATRRVSVEGAIYWELNPWLSTYGHIFVYTNATPGDETSALTLLDTGIVLPPDTAWHTFEVRADLLNRVYAGIVIDQQWKPLTGVALLLRQRPTWGNDTSLTFTCESENASPGNPPSYVNTWTTRFKDVKIYRSN